MGDILGGAGDFLFGEEAEMRPFSRMTGAQQGLLDKLSRYLTGQVGQGGPQYAGQLAAGASPLQERPRVRDSDHRRAVRLCLLWQSWAGGGGYER